MAQMRLNSGIPRFIVPEFNLDEFYFGWFGNSFIEIGKAPGIALISNHLK